MSLINDALKRANQTQRKRGHDYGIHSGKPLQPVEPIHSGDRNNLWMITSAAAVGVLMLVSVFFFFKWKQSERVGQTAQPDGETTIPTQIIDAAEPSVSSPPIQSAVAPQPQPTSTKTEQTVAPSGPNQGSSKTNPSYPTDSAGNASANQSTLNPTGASHADPARVSPDTFPDLVVKGIFLSTKNPSVMIDGFIYRPGESVKGARILRIEQDGVWFEFKGARKKILAY